ncbi:lysocardiolipin acyltransferase 1 isoform X2 [Eurytemora carolleeae]|uniref:lysocardiolipin acyltransferase 1 isoform X2 n=1 Tax=Eurytemora carolleeae TaxID=1294199 RepID=UPI000C76B242|nr:lysocardiolipin acyltransferase 1 isoform X2 [Eurytemora carolleeae]|eukprot:XP_023319759.1 lysocardiolipin acyltransferase 1-like isoform X2 [Eurytemora affinis]
MLMPGYIRGCSYVVLWYGSILLGFCFLYAPTLPLLLISRFYYRRTTDLLFSSWEAFNTTLLELVYGVEIVLTGDSIKETEDSLIVVNHPTRTDWNFLWPALFHASPSHNTKIVLKEELRKIPGMGWIMAMSRFIYLRRNWSQDSQTLDKMMDYYQDTREEGARQILLFPEGTNLSQSSAKKSDEYAVKNNLNKYNHVLHPRTSGFVHIAHGLRERNLLSSIYSLTIAYPDTVPKTEVGLLKGNLPRQVHVHIVRYPLDQVPSTFVGLEKWIQEVWRDKEKLLERFQETKEFIPLTQEQRLPCRTQTLQPMCLVAWFLFLYWGLCSVFTVCGILWILLVSSILVYTEHYTPGIQNIELKLHYRGSDSRIKTKNTEEESQDDFEHVKDN